MKLIIISGRSGSGTSVTLNVLEDMGYYCVDNLPLDLLPELAQKFQTLDQDLAISIDARNLTGDLENLERVLSYLKENHINYEIVFVNADENVLLNRFGETRRKHPLTSEMIHLKEALAAEKKLLQPIIDQADLQVDTTWLNVHELRELIKTRFQKEGVNLSLLFQSFGYKHGLPIDTDFTFDVRCLPNPYWEKNLRDLPGNDPAIVDYLNDYPQVQAMFEMLKNFIEIWLPAFEAENRKYLTISIGCTGGRHRSVYLAQKLKDYFAKKRKNVAVRHRDLV
jgi:UPF0042 nucleotide-binding protein